MDFMYISDGDNTENSYLNIRVEDEKSDADDNSSEKSQNVSAASDNIHGPQKKNEGLQQER